MGTYEGGPFFKNMGTPFEQSEESFRKTGEDEEDERQLNVMIE